MDIDKLAESLTDEQAVQLVSKLEPRLPRVNLVMIGHGGRKINAIGVIRRQFPHLSLHDAKRMVEEAKHTRPILASSILTSQAASMQREYANDDVISEIVPLVREPRVPSL